MIGSNRPHDRKKQLGAFYTPRPIAAKLAEWCIRSPRDRVMDPSFGGFVFLELARQRLEALGAAQSELSGLIYGIDSDPAAVLLARATPSLKETTIIGSDFFSLDPMDLPKFSVNIGNPPYVRYQNWDADESAAHAIAAGMGFKLSRLASLWAPFILHGCRFLEIGARLGQVLPAELLHAQYARPVIEYLVTSFQSVTVVVFEDRIFPGALEEVVLLFADGYGEGPASGIGLINCRDIDGLDICAIDGIGRGQFSSDMALLRAIPDDCQRIFERLALDPRVKRLADIAEVDIGAVTGANSFFLRTRAEIRQRKLLPSLFRTTVSKASDLAGARLTDGDIHRLSALGKRTELLVTASHSKDEIATVAELLDEGAKLGLPSRYKCRIRTPWWSVPLPRKGVPDAFLTYMSDAFPRMVCNDAKALSTNTIHNVAMRDGHSAAALAVGFYNSLTLLSAEIVGRSYGGGILKLEPTEAERMLIPSIDLGIQVHLAEIDSRLRVGDLDGVLNIVDPLVLGTLGLNEGDLSALRAARASLRARRRSRSKRPAE
ncbi:MAG: SAM-dependent DNA methyltransferase [Planctomycetes bacterium]|nr:SAM-dependent DNA methyltransferase [Planctomycetota bacterium]